MRIVPNVNEIKKLTGQFTASILRYAVLIVVLCAGVTTASAKHIVGGEITYVCLGGGDYRFTMTLYRDCSDPTGAVFDSADGAFTPATVTVYQGDSQVPFTERNLSAPVITFIDPNDQNPCIIVPPGLCLEEGIYVWEMNLPASPEPYHIVYQRCCRNSSITNIVNPLDAGATWRVELTAAAQSGCNSSPTFDEFPPVIICQGFPLEVDFSATDPDGDQLVYELCAPVLGGGNNTDFPNSTFGVAPQPDAPPPYDEVSFINPPYSANLPLNADPGLSIDANTGILSGTPQNVGQYVLGVCINEFRNGVLINTVYRDLQFNVAFCEPVVNADINETDILTLPDGGELYLVRNCGGTEVDFINQSVQEQFISDYRWEFDIDGQQEVFTSKDLTLDFPDIGTYDGSMMINPGTSCGDTLDIRVEIFPPVTADFEYEYDTCVAGPTTFTNLSFSEAGPNTIESYLWNFGDDSTSTQQNPVHTYMIPGSLPASLTVRDTNGCAATTIEPINYFPAPATIVVAPSAFIGCVPADIFFNNLSFPIDSTYDITWTFGDGASSGAISPTHNYDSVGVFTVSIDITSPIGCQIDTTFFGLIETRESPIAGFSFTPEEPSNLEPLVQFIDESQNEVVRWDWFSNEVPFSINPNPLLEFRDTGVVEIVQIVTHPNGCRDTAIQRLDIIPRVTYFLPNAFTPNDDGTNDFFFGQGILEGATDFEFRIWNRYGELIYETGDPYSEGWNGRKNNVGPVLAAGVYVVTAQYREPRGKLVTLKGFAALVK